MATLNDDKPDQLEQALNSNTSSVQWAKQNRSCQKRRRQKAIKLRQRRR